MWTSRPIEFRFVQLFDFEDLNMSSDVVYNCATCSKTVKDLNSSLNLLVNSIWFASTWTWWWSYGNVIDDGRAVWGINMSLTFWKRERVAAEEKKWTSLAISARLVHRCNKHDLRVSEAFLAGEKPLASNTMCPSDRWLCWPASPFGIQGGNDPRAAQEMQVIHFLPSVVNVLVQSINCLVDLRLRMASRRIQIFHYSRTMQFKCVEFLDSAICWCDPDKATKLSRQRRLERRNLRSSIKKTIWPAIDVLDSFCRIRPLSQDGSEVIWRGQCRDETFTPRLSILGGVAVTVAAAVAFPKRQSHPSGEEGN